MPKFVVPGQVHPSSRRHRSRDFRDIPRARRGDLRAALARQQGEGYARPESALADGVRVLDDGDADKHYGLCDSHSELPCSCSVAEYRA